MENTVTAATALTEPSRAVILDADGILLDPSEPKLALCNDLADQAGVDLDWRDLDMLKADTFPEAVSYFQRHFDLGISSQDLIQEAETSLEDYYRRRARLKPGAMELLQDLKANGISVAVTSSSPSSLLVPAFERLGVLGFIDRIFSATDEGRRRQSSGFIKHAWHRMGATGGNTWIVTSSIFKLQVARSLGLRTVGVFDAGCVDSSLRIAFASDHSADSLSDLQAKDFLTYGLI